MVKAKGSTAYLPSHIYNMRGMDSGAGSLKSIILTACKNEGFGVNSPIYFP